jgi:hypothetical protein
VESLLSARKPKCLKVATELECYSLQTTVFLHTQDHFTYQQDTKGSLKTTLHIHFPLAWHAHNAVGYITPKKN